MQRIDPEEFQQRLDRISEIFGQLAVHAEKQAQLRCPYKNKDGECTAQFGCRYQAIPLSTDSLPVCKSDDRLDYRSAWDDGAEDAEAMRALLRRRSEPGHGRDNGAVS